MIKVNKPGYSDSEWTSLLTRADTARARAIAEFRARRDVKINEDLYKEFMPRLHELFNQKCAYCETIIATNQPGDVEHFRPKGRVIGNDFRPLRCDCPEHGEIDHPGYYWLAYDWDNLLPACIDCNRYRRHGKLEEGAGKADRFPVADFRACAPGDECVEDPMLINPAAIDPAEHLMFLPDGRIKARSPKGTVTLELLGLNVREKLKDERGEAYEDGRDAVKKLLTAVLNENARDEGKARERLRNINRGASRYSALQRQAVDAECAAWAAKGVHVVFT
jgi:uncharacterized protein (TIGR02646 family)